MRERRKSDFVRALVLVVAWGATLSAQVTQRVSVNSGGVQTDRDGKAPSISADGRYVAFESRGTNLVPGDTNGVADIFVRDRQSGTTERVSVDSGDAQSDVDSFNPSISADGRFVAFVSWATNLVPGDTNFRIDAFVRDRQLGTTERVSVDSGGVQGNGYTGPDGGPSISADGRFVAFTSQATNLVPGDTNQVADVFVRDRQLGTTERVSVDSSGVQGNQPCDYFPSISADGRYVAFASNAMNLIAGDTNHWKDVFVHDRQLRTTERVSIDSAGTQGDSDSGSDGSYAFPGLSISADGRWVAFVSQATNLVPGDTNGKLDVFVHDRLFDTTERMSIDSGGVEAQLDSLEPSISLDGRQVSFHSAAGNLVVGDTNLAVDVFVRDRQFGTTERVSLDSGGAQGNGDSRSPSFSVDGRFVAFRSFATNFVPGDTNDHGDVFVRDFAHGGFTSLCEPGLGGVLACPCSNPPAGPERGCDNSSATGGASLAIAGGEYLSSDSLVLTSTGERSTALSLVLQGTASTPAGVIYGQGLRCVSGALKRLYAKTASGGSMSAPDFAVGDPTVHARSATLGDVIAAGSSRWYLVYYRDPSVLGGCPATSTFNATQTREVSWKP